MTQRRCVGRAAHLTLVRHQNQPENKKMATPFFGANYSFICWLEVRGAKLDFSDLSICSYMGTKS